MISLKHNFLFQSLELLSKGANYFQTINHKKMFFLFIVHFVGNTRRTKMHCWEWLLNIYKKIVGKIIRHKKGKGIKIRPKREFMQPFAPSVP